MVKEDMDPSCVFFINVNEPHILCASFQWWRFTTLEKGHGFWIKSLQNNNIWNVFIFLLITNE
jgi:hypothetical protein